MLRPVGNACQSVGFASSGRILLVSNIESDAAWILLVCWDMVGNSKTV